MRMNQWGLPQYEHMEDNMNISVVLLLGWPTRGQYCSTLMRLVIDQVPERIQGDWSISPHQTRAGFCLHYYCVRPRYISRLRLSPIGGKWGERAGPTTHSNTYGTHTNRKSRDPGIVSHSQNELLQRSFFFFVLQQKEHDGGSRHRASVFFK